MKKIAVLTISLQVLLTNVSYSKSLRPCTPVVPAPLTIMYCHDKKLNYSIEIETLMSRPLDICQGENYSEYHTAKVEIYDGEKKIQKINLLDGEFEYQLGPVPGDASFKSNRAQLNLNQCVTPLPGGVSFGN